VNQLEGQSVLELGFEEDIVFSESRWGRTVLVRDRWFYTWEGACEGP
jgi:hypothetical protein